MKTADITCPKCEHVQRITIPENKCLPFYRCEGCKKVITAPEGECCVICAYTDQKCPVTQTKREKQ